MGEFGDVVAALLETYSTCSSLLKRWQRYRKTRYAREETSKLRKQLRSDQKHVSTAYFASAARRGDMFRDGDGKLRTPHCPMPGQVF